MEPKVAANSRPLTRFVTRQSGRLCARAIPWLCTNTFALRAFLMIGLGVPVGTALWTLLASSILNKTQR